MVPGSLAYNVIGLYKHKIHYVPAPSNGGVDATLIAAYASAVGVIIAIAALIADGRRTRLSLGMNNLWKLIEGWDAPEMRRRRADVAAQLLQDPLSSQRISDEAIDVVNTFELLAFLVRSKTLRMEHAWVNFSIWAMGWWGVYEAAIRSMQEEDPTVFEDYAWLTEHFAGYEGSRREMKPEEVFPKGEAVVAFLRAESAITGRLLPPPEE
jgi:hypothetical protein